MENTDLRKSIGSLISKTNWYLRAYFNKKIKERNLNVTIEQWVVLTIVAQQPGITQTEIAKKGLKDKTNVTRILDLLEKNNYIKREKDKHDRRIYTIYVTEKGNKALSIITPLARQTNEESCVNIKNDDLIIVTESLEQICNTIKKEI
jgi:DNA-binding MarR family transcriptional regulator